MWNWDPILGLVAGPGASQRLRAKAFREDVKRAGIAQEERALCALFREQTNLESVPFSASAGNINHLKRATSNLCPASDSLAPSPLCANDSLVIPPGGLRPRRIAAFPQRLYNYEHLAAADAALKHQVEPEPWHSTMMPSMHKGRTPSSYGSGSFDQSEDGQDSGYCSVQSKPAEHPTGLVGVGRFQHPVDADPELIKAKLEKDLRGPGCFNFFDQPDGFLGTHPLLEQYNARVKALQAEGTYEPSPPVSTASTASRLAWKFRTECSTTVSPDGCVITKGFNVRGTAKPPPIALGSQKEPHVQTHEPYERNPKYRIACDELEAIDRCPKERYSCAAKRDRGAVNPASITFVKRQPPRVDEHPRAFLSELGPRGVTPSGYNPRALKPLKRFSPKCDVVSAQEAESAIYSDEEDEDEGNKATTVVSSTPAPRSAQRKYRSPCYGTLPKTSNNTPAPLKGILKKNPGCASRIKPSVSPEMASSATTPSTDQKKQRARPHFANKPDFERRPLVGAKKAVHIVSRGGTGRRVGYRPSRRSHGS